MFSINDTLWTFHQEGTWHSTNGINWKKSTLAATVHKNKIYITGGKYGGTPNHPEFRYDNDVWVLERK